MLAKICSPRRKENKQGKSAWWGYLEFLWPSEFRQSYLSRNWTYLVPVFQNQHPMDVTNLDISSIFQPRKKKFHSLDPSHPKLSNVYRAQKKNQIFCPFPHWCVFRHPIFSAFVKDSPHSSWNHCLIWISLRFWLSGEIQGFCFPSLLSYLSAALPVCWNLSVITVQSCRSITFAMAWEKLEGEKKKAIMNNFQNK